ncbi:MAG TPA: TerC family protein [Myxococcaceae bacterium]|nr:TerC family protein [Myxococcaceae bacterium]
MLSVVTLGSWPLWLGFLLFVAAMLALDLGVFHRKAHVVSLREAAVWSAVWISLAAVFALGVFHFYGAERGLEFTTGYFIEKALSVDNIFVMVVLFGAFKVPAHQQHRVLFWGILGALAMRAVFILAGTALIARFHWTVYVFGVFLVVTGVRLLLSRGEQDHPEDNVMVRLARRVLPVAPGRELEHFFTRVDGRRMVTPLFLALLAVEFTDLIFAVDSIPAVLAVSRDPFIVFTSNIFAILGLRSLYFLLAGVVHRFRYLKAGLALVLVFVGVKMAIVDIFKIPVGVSLAVVGLLITGAIVSSLVVDGRRRTLQERTATS